MATHESAPAPDDPLRQLTQQERELLAESTRQLTPEECQRLSDGTQDLEYTLSVTEAEQMEEDIHQKPLKYGTPAQAMAAMERRLVEMRQSKAELLNTLDDCSASLREALLKDLDQLNRTITDTQARLDAYRFQHRNEN
jgi:hypothetical protein